MYIINNLICMGIVAITENVFCLNTEDIFIWQLMFLVLSVIYSWKIYKAFSCKQIIKQAICYYIISIGCIIIYRIIFDKIYNDILDIDNDCAPVIGMMFWFTYNIVNAINFLIIILCRCYKRHKHAG